MILKNFLISIITYIIGIAAGITAMYSVVKGSYIITICSVVILCYLAYLERHGKISAW